MKKANRKGRADKLMQTFSKEIASDPRLKVNKNAIASILAYERTRIKHGKTLLASLIEKFTEEGNKDAISALLQGHKLVFEEASEKWVDSERLKAEHEEKMKRMWEERKAHRNTQSIFD